MLAQHVPVEAKGGAAGLGRESLRPCFGPDPQVGAGRKSLGLQCSRKIGTSMGVIHGLCLIVNSLHACMHAKSIQSHLTLCDPVDSSPPGFSVHGIL